MCACGLRTAIHTVKDHLFTVMFCIQSSALAIFVKIQFELNEIEFQHVHFFYTCSFFIDVGHFMAFTIE